MLKSLLPKPGKKSVSFSYYASPLSNIFFNKSDVENVFQNAPAAFISSYNYVQANNPTNMFENQIAYCGEMKILSLILMFLPIKTTIYTYCEKHPLISIREFFFSSPSCGKLALSAFSTQSKNINQGLPLAF